jgi:hypothetical protein
MRFNTLQGRGELKRKGEGKQARRAGGSVAPRSAVCRGGGVASDPQAGTLDRRKGLLVMCEGKHGSKRATPVGSGTEQKRGR